MKRTRWIAGLAPALFVFAVGCGGSQNANSGGGATTEAAAPDVAQVGAGETTDDSTADLAEHHRHHHHGGFAMFIAMSLDSINTTPEQHDQIVKIQAEMHAKMQPAHDAEKTLLLAVADGVEAGQIDPAKIDPLIQQMATTSAAVHDAVADSQNALHALLTPPQRVALVDKVEAHLEVWHHTNSADEGSAKDAHGGHIGHLAKELSLTPDQVEKVRTSFHSSIGNAPKYDRSLADAHFKAFAAAFASDTFDAKTLTTAGPANAHMATWGAHRMVHLYTAMTPVLTPEQRTKLAADIRSHANYKRSETEK